MKKTIEWFKQVKDEKLRNELLDAYDESYSRFKHEAENLADAINIGFDWSQKKRGPYWMQVHEKSENNEIELLPEPIEQPKEYNYNVNIKGVEIDVYNVLKAFNVISPPIQHAIKKLLRSELKGHKNQQQDYNEAIKSIERAKELLNE